ncbi:uncharacterized protein [Lolium perenne]|jgi:hypothetical protein|uniref:uncharacterized protein n=1 Tax=Lolium perenne TaxID=4522 RepID=UPI0021F62989|nr:uncharacterized protein LOC127338923 [Lolium perenne]
MVLRQLCLCGLCICLLLGDAFGAGGQIPTPQDGVVLASGDCYKTATSVPSWCSGEFIQALFDGAKNIHIKGSCCALLSCVGESTCASVLRDVCPPPAKGVDWPCPPHQDGRVY